MAGAASIPQALHDGANGRQAPRAAKRASCPPASAALDFQTSHPRGAGFGMLDRATVMREVDGAGGEDRTPDLRFTKPLHYRCATPASPPRQPRTSGRRFPQARKLLFPVRHIVRHCTETKLCFWNCLPEATNKPGMHAGHRGTTRDVSLFPCGAPHRCRRPSVRLDPASRSAGARRGGSGAAGSDALDRFRQADEARRGRSGHDVVRLQGGGRGGAGLQPAAPPPLGGRRGLGRAPHRGLPLTQT